MEDTTDLKKTVKDFEKELNKNIEYKKKEKKESEKTKKKRRE